MKICITSQGDDLDSLVDPKFGRCAFFIIFDLNTRQFEAMANDNSGSSGGAGIQSGQLMASKDVKAVLTGNCGPNAFQTLKTAGIDIIAGVSGKISDAIARYQKGEFKPIDSASTGPHSGLKGNK